MTPAPTRPHVAAITALLTGGGLAVLSGGQGSPVPPPCVVLWPTPGSPGGSSLGSVDDALYVEVTTVACGSTADQAMWVADKVTSLLNRQILTIAGRVPYPLVLASVAPVERDDSLSSPLFGAALRWRLVTVPT